MVWPQSPPPLASVSPRRETLPVSHCLFAGQAVMGGGAPPSRAAPSRAAGPSALGASSGFQMRMGMLCYCLRLWLFIPWVRRHQFFCFLPPKSCCCFFFLSIEVQLVSQYAVNLCCEHSDSGGHTFFFILFPFTICHGILNVVPESYSQQALFLSPCL